MDRGVFYGVGRFFVMGSGICEEESLVDGVWCWGFIFCCLGTLLTLMMILCEVPIRATMNSSGGFTNGPTGFDRPGSSAERTGFGPRTGVVEKWNYESDGFSLHLPFGNQVSYTWIPSMETISILGGSYKISFFARSLSNVSSESFSRSAGRVMLGMEHIVVR